MELRQFEYFVAVVEEASFTKAAARVHVAQPGVSAQIRRLEREFGHELLDRSGRTVQLTDVGTAVLPYARAALAAVEGARLAVDDLAGLTRGQVTFGTVASSSSLALPELLARFHERYPSVDMALSEGNSDQLAEAIRAGRIDVAVIGLAGEPPGDLDIQVIADELLVGAVGHDHGLAEHQEVSVEEIRDHTLICLPPGTGLRTAVEAAWAAAGARPRIAFEASDPGVLAQLAARGLGLAILPQPFIRSHARRLHTVTIASPHLRGRLALAWRSTGPISPAARAFIAYARESLADLGPGSPDARSDA
ncbi:LysR family transcriptional regulator [Streptomyces sp. NPDC001922]|uniref:LysR family transcriptional regulator n=1 Tax=Streptomyces sp. NPDC001922 TaxID=3364624 RepID=UPI00368E4CC4